MSNTTYTSPITFAQQFLYIGVQILRIKTLIQGLSPQAPTHIIEELNQLYEHVNRLSKTKPSNDEEQKDLNALVDISQVVNSSLQLNDVLRIVMDTIIRLTEAERGFLMLKGEDGKLTIRIARNWEQESIRSSEFAISRTVVNRVVESGKPIVTTNAQEDPRFGGQESVIIHNLRSILCVPLMVKDQLTGVIYADNRIKSGIFTKSDRDILAAFANQAAVAIDNAQLFESVQKTLAEVTELKNMMDNIFASIASGVITADTSEKITLCNMAAERILGQASEKIIGMDLRECLSPLANELASPINQVRQTDQPLVGIELNPRLPERGRVDLVLNLSPLKDANQTTQGIAIVLDDLTEKKRLEAQKALFERMVPPAIIDQLDLNTIRLGGERATITTMFADVRGFTSFSEALPPEQLVSILNLYLAAAAESVLAQEGTLDKFMGDAVMAIFNAPIQQEDHTLRAVRAAIGIRDELIRVHRQLPKRYWLSFGVGIHYGDAILGLVGTEKRVDYTAIGDSINTAKRIQENAAGGQILISKEAFKRVRKNVKVRHIEPIYAKGKSEPLEAYEVLNIK